MEKIPRVRRDLKGLDEKADGKGDASTQTSSDISVDASTQITSDISGERETLRLRDDLLKAKDTISNLNEKMEELKKQIALLQLQKDNLQSRLFTSERFLSCDSTTAFYTGFPSAEVF